MPHAAILVNNATFRFRTVGLPRIATLYNTFDALPGLPYPRRTILYLAYHILGEPYPPIGIDVDADAHAVQRGAEKMNAVPAAEWFVSHAFVN